MIQPINEAEQDYAFSEGFLREWLKDAPTQVKEHLTILTGGISYYREKYLSAQEEYARLNDVYAKVSAQSIEVLKTMQQQTERIAETERLIEEQREQHHWMKPRGPLA